MNLLFSIFFFFFFNDTATTEIYTLSLHDALPIWIANGTCTSAIRHGKRASRSGVPRPPNRYVPLRGLNRSTSKSTRSEEHTSELQSQSNLVCRLLLEKKKNV